MEDEGAFRAAFSVELPDGFLVGFAFRRLSHDERIEVASQEGTRLRLAAAPAQPLATGEVFEVVSPEPAPVLAARLALGGGSPRPAMRLATTRGTNALLTRSGARVAFFTTRGFGDLLVIGDQTRPDLFARSPRRPTPLPEVVVEVSERIAADGTVLEPIDLAAAAAEAERLRKDGFDAAAVCLLHAWKNPAHERTLGARLCEVGFSRVVLSSEVAPRLGLLARAETATVEAYLAGVVGEYLDDVGRSTSSLHVMTSAGGLVRADRYRAFESLLSGPAGGVVGAAAVARAAGCDKAVSFDMGGTSTDVSRIERGEVEYRSTHRVGETTLAAPAAWIETIAAGGGSICRFDGMALTVGPDSAGADPGPACYGAGGPLTLTDVNLLLGRLDPDRFEIPLSREASEAAWRAVAEEIEAATGRPADREATLRGFLDLANERMADAIRRVTLARGEDPAEYTLIAFGGAGPQHALAVAERLGMRTVIVPAEASFLSAVGLSAARVERIVERDLLRPLDAVLSTLDDLLAELEAEGRGRLFEEGIETAEVVRRTARLRYAGQETALDLPVDPPADLAARFRAAHERIYGHAPERPVEVRSLRVVVAERAQPERAQPERAQPGGARSTLAGLPPPPPGETRTTVVLEPGWRREAGEGFDRYVRTGASSARAPQVPHVRRRGALLPHDLALVVHRLQAICEEMGEVLRRSALSTNVRERLDFSCALLDAEGRLVVNAPHIPVHLGALGRCVRSVREVLDLRPGDVAVTNHPYFGGSHLPDVTVIAPVFRGRDLAGYVASRAHHAEIGGRRPGSMPADATNLAEEGVVIPPTYLFRCGRARWREVEELLAAPPYPSRAVRENLADLTAAVAAVRRGASAFAALDAAAAEGALRALRGYAASRARAAYAALERIGETAAADALDDGTPISVRIFRENDQVVFDFESGPVHPGNLNATPAIVESVVLYCLRLFVNEPLPLNEGLLDPVEIRLPPNSLLAPDFPDDPSEAPAVGGGNVETSQRLADLVLAALRGADPDLPAASQGTMNNVVFGDETFGHYETIGGGAGATPSADGFGPIQVHMTNTRATDAEVLEHRYPVRLRRFAIRRGSGGTGARRGGDGAVREYEFLAPLSVSVLSQRRARGAPGADGGGEGAPGRQYLVRSDGAREVLASLDRREVRPGDRLVVETPGGGGMGVPRSHGEIR